MSRKSLFVPLAVFFSLVAVLGIGFSLDDPHLLPSELIDREFPAFSLPSLEDPDRTVTQGDLVGQVALVNIWATWCANCIIEHPELLRISREEGIPIFGVNYNDDTAKAIRWLDRYESPYVLTIVDADGKLGIDLGVYGAPETFIIDSNGVIQLRHVGVVSRETFEQKFVPVIEHLKQREARDAAS